MPRVYAAARKEVATRLNNCYLFPLIFGHVLQKVSSGLLWLLINSFEISVFLISPPIELIHSGSIKTYCFACVTSREVATSKLLAKSAKSWKIRSMNATFLDHDDISFTDMSHLQRTYLTTACIQK